MTNATTLTFTRHIKASRAAIWRCWTEPALLKKWFAPAPVSTTEAEMDARPGGIFRTVMEVPEHGTMAGNPGCVLVADAEQRLVWTNALGPEFCPNAMGDGPMDFAFTAEILITPAAGGSTYTVVVQHATDAAREVHENMGFFEGWGAAADQMAELAASL